LAAVFTHQGGYASPQVFVDGFAPALWVGAGLSALGVIAALLSPGRIRRQTAADVVELVPSLDGESNALSERAS
jgi:hypothetical protein